MASKYFRKALAEVRPAERRYVKKNLDIVEQIVSILNEHNMSQRDLAQRLGKTEAEVSRMLSGLHNLTLKTLTRLETALGEDIIITPHKARAQDQGSKQARVHCLRSQTTSQAVGAENYLIHNGGHDNHDGGNYRIRTNVIRYPSNHVVNFKRTRQSDQDL